uniref:Uncharacterized protein n=1 Tax=Sipha flava TaxID=143950 RepID=A0A2S2QY44_9HEMI
MAQLGVGQVHEARDGHRHQLRGTVVGGVHDGPGQQHQPAVRRLPDGQDRPEEDHRRAGTAVHRVVVAAAVRVHRVGAVPGPADGRHGQGHVVHGGAGVPGRDRGREHPRSAGHRVHSAAEQRRAVRSDRRAARVVSHAERCVGRGAGAVRGHVRVRARVAILPAEEGPPRGRGRGAAVVSRAPGGWRGRGAAHDGDERAQGHGEPVDVPRAVHQPEELQRAHGGGDGVRGAARGRHQQPDRVLGAHTARARAHHRQVRLHHGVLHRAGGGQLRRHGASGPGGPQAAAARLRAQPGRDHRAVRALLLPGRARRRRVRVHVLAVRVPPDVLRYVRHRHRVHTGRVPRRDVPRQHPLALLRHRVRHARHVVVRLQQDVPVGVQRVRVPHHVLGLCGRQLHMRGLRVPVRDRDHRQNVLGDPGDVGAQRGPRHQQRGQDQGDDKAAERPAVAKHALENCVLSNRTYYRYTCTYTYIKLLNCFRNKKKNGGNGHRSNGFFFDRKDVLTCNSAVVHVFICTLFI